MKTRKEKWAKTIKILALPGFFIGAVLLLVFAHWVSNLPEPAQLWWTQTMGVLIGCLFAVGMIWLATDYCRFIIKEISKVWSDQE